MNDSLNRIQLRLLEMAKETTKVLENHNVPYSLAYGSLLGAIRHKGFIPWDEDFDLFLFNDTFEQAKDYLRKELPDRFFLEDEKSEPNYFHAWAHVKDLNTIVSHDLWKHDDSYRHKGLSIDLYVLTKLEMKDLWDFLNSENRRYINRRKELGLMMQDEYDRRLKQIEENEKHALEHPLQSTELTYANITMHKKKTIDINVIHPLKKYVFEDTEFYGMNKADRFLTDIYGNYMILPPVDKRTGGHDSVIFLD